MIFQAITQVEIQGDEVLQFIQRGDDFVKYQIIGFTSPIIEVFDYRKSSLHAIDYVLNTNDLAEFPEVFSSPAYVEISNRDSQRLAVTLKDTEEKEISTVLWIAIGIDEPIPYCDYSFYKLAYLDQQRFAFISIFDNYGDKYEFAVSNQLTLSDS